MDSINTRDLPYADREYFLYQILAPYYRIDDNITIKYASFEIKRQAAELYRKKYNELRYHWINENTIIETLVELGLWDETKEKELNVACPKNIEHFKLQIYEKFNNSKERERARRLLNNVLKTYGDLYAVRHSLDYLTAEGISRYLQNQFIIEHTTYENDKLCDWNKVGINYIIQSFYKKRVPDNVIRIIARTEPWISIWSAFKKTKIQIFENTILSDEQTKLINWSGLYDNLHEAAEPPTEEVIADDDALDGWLIAQRKKKEQEGLDEQINNLNAKGNEIFLFTKGKGGDQLSQEDANKIYNSNSPMAKSIIKSRREAAIKYSEVSQENLPDVKYFKNMEENRNEHNRR